MYFTPNNNPWCTNCSLHRQRDKDVKAVHTHSRTPFSNILLFIIASYPGNKEEKQGLSLVGESGIALHEAITEVMDDKSINIPKCYRPFMNYVAMGNALRCNPKKEKISKTHRNTCKNWLSRDLLAMDSKVPILVCGSEAKKALFGDDGSLYAMRGKVHKYESHPVVITVNPVVLVRYRTGVVLEDNTRVRNDIVTGSPSFFFMKDLILMRDVVNEYINVILDGDYDEELISRRDAS